VSRSGRRHQVGLAPRLLLALLIVLATAAVTAWVVGALVGPRLFHQHMVEAGLDDNDAAVLHAEEAFRSATSTAATLAFAAAALASAGVSVVLARRIAASLGAVSTAAAALGAGTYGVRVPSSGLGAEFDQLAGSFNAMADRLEDAQRLRERLLADLAHEVRTPIATIAGYLEAVEDGVRPMDDTTVAVLRDQADRLTRLSHDLSAVTHAEAGDVVLDLELAPPEQLVHAAVQAAAERAADAGVELRAHVDPGVPAVSVDRHRMAQVLDNLVTNALRHTPPGGSVSVLAGRQGGAVTFTVSDTGDGIAAEHLPHVFERFYRADVARDRDSGGSGIGLAISKALTEAHGGTILASSPGPGRGADFVVRLPAAS